jgi:6-pyruvoyltetrahydropterin/6-carboxytetrahydropterin synthase
VFVFPSARAATAARASFGSGGSGRPSRRPGSAPEFFAPITTPMPDVTVTRRLMFNAAHRVHNPALSDEENRRLFGKCNNPNWHGHNYTLDVSVRGPIDERTGYVLDLGALKRLVEERVVDKIDHKNFNLDVDFMRGVIPTSENIIVAIWRELAPAIHPRRLTRLVLWETPNNYVEYSGE